tara:strand:- start:114 stop:236 length:123 start_codon:yes stop_codon:yes gene_type:complete
MIVGYRQILRDLVVVFLEKVRSFTNFFDFSSLQVIKERRK